MLTNDALPLTGWSFQNSGTNQNLNSVSFVNSSKGWIAGDNGIILSTTNGGINWVPQNSSTILNLNSVCFVNQSTGWAAGDTGIVVFTSNGGLTWNVQQNGLINVTLHSIFFTNALTGYIVGFEKDLGPTIMKTTNSGTLWTRVNYDLPAANIFNSVHFPTPTEGYVVTGGGKIYTTANGFILNPQTSGVATSLNSVYFINNVNGFIAGDNGVILNTFNGSTWFPQQSGVNNNLKTVYFPTVSTGWIAGGNGIVLRTSNSGVNWAAQNTGLSATLNSIVFTDNLSGWAVGDSGKVVFTNTGGLPTNISQIGSTIPEKYFLGQNYPNPFNPRTVISCQLSVVSDVVLKVFDVQGREVETLVNERLQPGVYEVSFDGSRLNSGVYFYRLSVHHGGSSTNDFTETKRMVLLK